MELGPEIAPPFRIFPEERDLREAVAERKANDSALHARHIASRLAEHRADIGLHIPARTRGADGRAAADEAGGADRVRRDWLEP